MLDGSACRATRHIARERARKMPLKAPYAKLTDTANSLSTLRSGCIANVMLAMHPDLSVDRLFAVSVSLAYGAFSGIFLARALAMWRVARQAEPSSMAY